MSITVCLIVRNEEATIGRCLDSVIGVADNAFIIDTGSDDNTIAVIEQHPLPTICVQRPWINFGHNRSELMREAKGRADWLLLLDADMELVADNPLPDSDVEAFTIRHLGGWEYDTPRILRGDLNWRFEQPTHEYLTLDQPYRRAASGWQIIHHADGGSRHDKFERDYRLLYRHHVTHRDDARTIFYLARTCEDMGVDTEAVAWYQLRASMTGTWEEERWWAEYRAAYLISKQDAAAGVGRLYVAWESRPHRAEPLARIIELSIRNGWGRIEQEARRLREGCDRKDDILFVEAAAFAGV